MQRVALLFSIAVLAVSVGHSSPPADWAINATAIEACSCPHFCMCYFNEHPAAHEEHNKIVRFCKFNIVYRVNKGNYGSTDLAGVKIWLSGDLGGDFSHDQMDWAVVTFDKAASSAQRQALAEIMTHVFPVKWNSYQTAIGDIDTWNFDKDQAHAALNHGQTAEVRLKRFPGMTAEPAILTNVRYWGTPRNDGFLMMPSELETYKEGPKRFEFKETNGFMVTFDMTSKDPPAHEASSNSH